MRVEIESSVKPGYLTLALFDGDELLVVETILAHHFTFHKNVLFFGSWNSSIFFYELQGVGALTAVKEPNKAWWKR